MSAGSLHPNAPLPIVRNQFFLLRVEAISVYEIWFPRRFRIRTAAVHLWTGRMPIANNGELQIAANTVQNVTNETPSSEHIVQGLDDSPTDTPLSTSSQSGTPTIQPIVARKHP